MPDTARRPEPGRDRAPGLLLPGLLLLAAAAALVLCAAGSPWDEAPTAALVISLLSAAPLVCLAWMTLRVRARAVGLHRQAQADRRAMFALASLGEAVRARLREARRIAVQAQDVAGTPEAATDGLAGLPLPPATNTSLVRAALDYWTRRYGGGEDVQTDALRAFLGERSLDLLEPLQRSHETAFAVGLAGTVLGLGVQTFLVQRMTEGSLLSQTFLTGVVLKASATFVGILVAGYARSLRWHLLARHDGLIDEIERFVSLQVAPMSDRASATGDWAEAVRRIVGHLDGSTHQMARTMAATLRASMRATRRDLKRLLTTDLAQALTAQLTAPFAREMEALRFTIRDAGEAVGEGTSALRGAAGEVKAEIGSAIAASSGFLEQLQEAREVVSGVRGQFEHVLAQVTSAADLMAQVRGELELSVERMRATDPPWDHDGRLAGEVMQAAEALRDGQRSFTQALHEIVEIQGSNGRGAPARPLRPAPARKE